MKKMFLLACFMAGMVAAGTAVEKIYGGDFAKGTPVDSLEFIILGIPGYDDGHNLLCHQAILSADPEAKVAYYPWDFFGADEVVGRLGVCVVAPVNTAEIHAYKLTTDCLWFVCLSAWYMVDTTRSFGDYPPRIGSSGVCVTTGDCEGRVIGPYGPNVEFVEHWERDNRRSFVLSKVAGKFSFVRRRAAEVFGLKLSWQETREICRSLAPAGGLDSLGRRESLCGVIDITPSKVDSALAVFFYKRAAAVKVERGFLPEFSLRQNYPNPFNPETTIEYALPQQALVRLAVYDLMGRQVELLINEQQQSGTHRVNWNAAGVPSGTYICRLSSSSGFSLTRRMTLVR